LAYQAQNYCDERGGINMGDKLRKHYTPEFKAKAVEFSREKFPFYAACEFGVPLNTLKGWIYQAKYGNLPLVSPASNIRVKGLCIVEINREDDFVAKKTELISAIISVYDNVNTYAWKYGNVPLNERMVVLTKLCLLLDSFIEAGGVVYTDEDDLIKQYDYAVKECGVHWKYFFYNVSKIQNTPN
jgi:transposase-like protein